MNPPNPQNVYCGSGAVFAQFVRAMGVARGDALAAEAFAQGKGWHATGVATVCKALSTALGTSDVAGALRPVTTDFSQYVRGRTVLGRLTGLRRAPFRVRMVEAVTGSAAAWVQPGQPLPVTSLSLSDGGEQLLPLKLGAIGIVSLELARHSNPVVEGLVARDASAATVSATDVAFLDPDNAGSDAAPASVTYGAAQFTSRGSTIQNIGEDLKDMLGVPTAFNLPLENAAWVAHPTTATFLALARGTDGSLAFPGVTPKGGVLAGLPLLVTNACATTGSPVERFLTLIVPDEILLADDGEAEVDISGHTSVQLDTAPQDGAQPLVSLWQLGLIGVRTTRTINWKRRRAAAVATLRGLPY